MSFLTCDKLLLKQKLEIIKIDLGNDDYVYVREMTGRERDAYEVSLLPEKGEEEREMTDFRAKLVVRVACDKDGKNIFKLKDYTKLSQNISGRRLRIIANAASKLNKISEEEKKEIEKNSEAVQDGNSTSDSAGN